jgi:hypothetical protein
MRRDRACRTCGTVAPRAARYCGRCGERVVGRTAPAQRARRPAFPRTAQLAAVLMGIAALILVGFLGTRGPTGVGTGRSVATTTTASATVPDEVVLPTADGIRAAEDDRSPADGPTEGGSCEGRAGAVDCVRWSTDLGVAEPRSVVAVGWTVAIAEQDGQVRTFSASDGRPRWRHTASGAPRFHGPVADTLPITGDGATTFVDVATGRDVGDFDGRPRATAASGPWLLVVDDDAIEARSVTGSSAWRVPVPPDGLGWVTANGPYLTSAVSLRQDRLVRLSSNTGEVTWERTIAGRVASLRPLGSATLVAVEDTGDGAAVLVVDRTGAVVVDHRLAGRVAAVAPDAAGAAVITAGPTGAALLLVDAATGRMVGPLALGRGGDWPLPVTIDGDLVAVARTDPAPGITVLGRSDGTVRQQIDLPAVPRSLAFPDGHSVVAVVDTEVSAWSLSTGAARWRLELGRPVDVVSERPLLVRTDRTLVALDADPSRPRRQARGTTS